MNAGYTLLARLVSDRVGAASALLAKLEAHPERLPFAKSATTHFATLTILPAQMYGDEELPATLMLATSFCGPTRTHVMELVHVMGDGLREVFQHCEGFVVGCSNAGLEAFILEHRHADTFYTGMQNLSPEDVRRHQALREAIEAYVDERQTTGGFRGSAVDIQREIQDHVKACTDLAWAERSFEPPPGTWLALHWRALIAGAIVLPFVAALLICTTLRLLFVHDATIGAVVACGWGIVALVIALVVGLVVAVRDAECDQRYVAGRHPDAHVRALAATQNRPVINEFTVAGPLKEGTFRPVVLRIAFWIVARVAEGIPGLISGIDIPTVATARWIAADRGRRLIFISNYTNAAEPYVRDFIDVHDGAMRINLTFGFGRGYPKTRWVIKDGALTDPNGFIYVVTENQRPTAFWYGPYRDLSIDNIKINRQIREGLFATLDEDRAQAWLHLL